MTCQAIINPLYWKTPDEYRQCSHTPSIRIDEVNLCGQHAGQIAIEKVKHLGKAKELPKLYTYHPDIIKCEATTNPTCRWMGKDVIDFPDCTSNATIFINGLNLCRRHAWILAIQELIKIGQAEYISGSPDSVCTLGDRWAKYMQR